MTFKRRQFLTLAGAAVLAPAVTRVARAQAYPARQVRLIIGYPPGGSADITARLIANSLSERLGQQFIVESRAGGGTNIATEAVINAPPDGYTLLLVAPANAINATLYEKMNHVFLRDIVPIAGIIRFPNVVVVNPNVPVKTIPELIAYAKANPGKVRYASVGIGSNNHYDTEAFAKWAGIQMLHLPNKGGGAAITNDLVTGDAQVAFVNAASSGGVIKGGQLRALAVMADERVPEYPDVPTLRELGYAHGKGLWSALYAPAATPRDVLETLHKAAVQSLKSEPVTTAFKKQMIKAVPSASIDEAKAWDKTETAHWKKLTEEIKVELPD
jgi:tripartite-type tricarboxylate transporter receptor subunit TctC